MEELSGGRGEKCKRGTGDAESRKKFQRVGGEPLDTGEKKNNKR